MTWPDNVDAVLAGDQVTMLGYVTPASGVVLTPMTNFDVHDRDAGKVAANSSVGAWKKLDRIRRNPRVALAYHSREHGFADGPEYVLVQGDATLAEPDPDYASSIAEQWERFAGPRHTGAVWRWVLRVYYRRVEIQIAVRRIVVWPDLECRGDAQVIGAPLPTVPPEPQLPPAKGTGPRMNHRRAAKRARKLPHRLLGWVGSDGYPVVVPVEILDTEAHGIALGDPSGLMPPGGRRAGLTAHLFTRYAYGQNQRIHTGWLDDGVYAPHTTAAYRLPPSRVLFHLVAGLGTRARLRAQRSSSSS